MATTTYQDCTYIVTKDSYWDSLTTAQKESFNEIWLKLSATTAFPVNKIRIYFNKMYYIDANLDVYQSLPSDIIVESSDNGTEWTTVLNISDNKMYDQTYEITTQTKKHWRLKTPGRRSLWVCMFDLMYKTTVPIQEI